MTALAAVFSSDASSPILPPQLLTHESLRIRGVERAESWSAPHAALHVARYLWECTPQLAGETLVAIGDDVTVISDASLYHRRDLTANLVRAGASPPTDSAADAILAAYLAWGPDCAGHLEGDFSFVLWDARRQQALIARDFVGRRPLFHARSRRGHLILASSARSVAAHPDVNAPIDRSMVAAAVAGLLGGSNRSGFEGVESVRAGVTLLWTPDRGLREHAAWKAPLFTFRGRAKTDVRDAAVELRELLIAATATRIAEPVTGVWLSGGADSPAVFAAARAAEQREGLPAIQPVSVSFPEGDIAREDDLIKAIASEQGSSVRWVNSESMSIFERIEQRARERDDPYAHTHEAMNRALARESLAAGARVGFDGYGGDQLFYVSYTILADLFAMLRWFTLARTLRQLGIRDRRVMFRWCVLPLIPESAKAFLGKARGRPFASQQPQALAPWLTRDVATQAGLLAMAHMEPARRFGESLASHESRFYVTSPYFPRAVSWAAGFGLAEGIEMRSPILDERVLRFAASRPVQERSPVDGGKHLLRESMRGLIPESVLAPRREKTGIPRGYFHRQMQREFSAHFARVFDQPGATVALAELGIVDVGLVREGLAQYRRLSDHLAGIQLFLTLQAEYWLRSVGG